MRISDWSSDVCSSDLIAQSLDVFGGHRHRAVIARLVVAVVVVASEGQHEGDHDASDEQQAHDDRDDHLPGGAAGLVGAAGAVEMPAVRATAVRATAVRAAAVRAAAVLAAAVLAAVRVGLLAPRTGLGWLAWVALARLLRGELPAGE